MKCFTILRCILIFLMWNLKLLSGGFQHTVDLLMPTEKGVSNTNNNTGRIFNNTSNFSLNYTYSMRLYN